jgi:zinc protease
VTVAFRAPAFSDTKKDQAALSMLLSLSFGRTSPLYKRLVQDEQKVDQLFDYTPARVDPSLVTIGARVKKPADALYVRNAILETVAKLRDVPVTKQALMDAQSSEKYGLIRSLDNTDTIAQTLASYVHYDRFLRHDQPLLPPDRHPHPGRPAGRRAQIPGRRRHGGDHALA